MATLDSLVVRLAADSSELRKELVRSGDLVAAQSRRMNKSLEGISGGFAKLSGALGAFGVALGGVAIASFGVSALRGAAQMADLADAVGLSTTKLQEYQFAAAASGVKTEQLAAALGFFAKNVGEARGGGNAAIEMFRRLGVSTQEANGAARTQDAILRDVADAFQRLEDPTARAAAARELFGRGSQTFVNLLAQGSQGLDASAAAAHRFGAVLSEETIKSARDFDDALDLSLVTVKSWAAALGSEVVVKPIQDFIRRQKDMASSVADFTGSMLQSIHDFLSTPERDSPIGRSGTVRPPTGPGPKPSSAPIALPISSEQELAALKDRAAAERSVNDLRILQQQRLNEAAAQYDRDREAAFERGAEVIRADAAAIQERLDRQRENEEQTRREIEVNDALLAALQISEREYAIVAATIELNNKARAAGLPLTEAEIAKNRELAETIGAQREQIDRLKEAAAANREAMRDLSRVIGTAFEDAILKGGSLRDVMRGLLEDIERIILRASVTKPLEGLLGGDEGGGGLLGSISDALDGIFGGGGLPQPGPGDQIPGFAAGGDPPVGRPSVVGEAGPEVFVPRVPGTIVPAGGFGGGVTVVQNISIAPDVSAVARAEIMRQLPLIRRHAMVGVFDAQLRGAAPG